MAELPAAVAVALKALFAFACRAFAFALPFLCRVSFGPLAFAFGALSLHAFCAFSFAWGGARRRHVSKALAFVASCATRHFVYFCWIVPVLLLFIEAVVMDFSDVHCLRTTLYHLVRHPGPHLFFEGLIGRVFVDVGVHVVLHCRWQHVGEHCQLHAIAELLSKEVMEFLRFRLPAH